MASRGKLVAQVRAETVQAQSELNVILNSTSNPTIGVKRILAAEQRAIEAIQIAAKIARDIASEDGCP